MNCEREILNLMKKLLTLLLGIIMIMPLIVSCTGNTPDDTTGNAVSSTPSTSPDTTPGTVPDTTVSDTTPDTTTPDTTTPDTTTQDQTSDTTTGTGDDPIGPTGGFDESKIVLSFGAISDTHLRGNSGEAAEIAFRNAVAELKKQALIHDEDGLDAITIAGDMTDHGTTAQVNHFGNIVKSLNFDTTVHRI
jgi:hypothetical protein